MAFTTVIVDATDKKRPREIQRDARDPQGPAQKDLERMADNYSRGGRTIRLYPAGQYVTPWRKRKAGDCEYEAFDGQATPDFRPI